MKNILEVCAGDIESIIAAAKGGADRIELCSALSEGGITPSIGLIRKALEVPGIKVNVLIRPRGGDFIYSEDEVECMVADIEAAKEAGVNGVVIGALTPEGDIDIPVCQQLMTAAKGLSVTFHRAFDRCRNPEKALEQIIDLGCDRILSSGQAGSALEGKEMLAAMVRQARGRIIILAGAGVSESNAAEIIRFTGTNEIHASARKTISSSMTYRTDNVAMGSADCDDFVRKTTCADTVRLIVARINE